MQETVPIDNIVTRMKKKLLLHELIGLVKDKTYRAGLANFHLQIYSFARIYTGYRPAPLWLYFYVSVLP
jgi:hypothetical protein